ncbi:putative membrane protein [Paenibacillus polymyxa]
MESRVFKILVVQMIIGMAFMANHWAVYTTAVLTLIHIFLPQVTAMITDTCVNDRTRIGRRITTKVGANITH